MSDAEKPSEVADAAADGEVKESGDTTDPYAYLQNQGFSSENFKIEVCGLPKYYGLGQLKKLFNSKLQLNAHKLKPAGKGFQWMYVCFKNEEDRQKSLKVLNGYEWKKCTLSAQPAKAVADPVAVKRKEDLEKEENVEGDGPEAKKAKLAAGDAESSDDPPTTSVIAKVKEAVIPLSEVPYKEQLQKKTEEVRTFVTDLGNEIKDTNPELASWLEEKKVKYGFTCELKEIRPSPATDQYRNKCEFTVGLNPETQETTVGFRLSSYKEGSMGVGPIDGMRHLPQKMTDAVQAFQTYLELSDLPPYNPEKHEGYWKQLTVRTTRNGDMMLIVIVHPQSLTPQALQELKDDIKMYFEKGDGKWCGVTSLYFQAVGQKEAGAEYPLEHVSGATYITETLCDLKFRISPEAFFQVNTRAAETLYSTIGEVAQLTNMTSLVDVCCGTGTIGLSLAKQCGQVLGLELVHQAVEDARLNASENHISNCEFFAGKAEDFLGALLRRTAYNDVIAVVDPPRAGLHQKAIFSVRKNERLNKLVYVACDAKAAMKNFIDLGRPRSNTFKGNPFVPVKIVPVDLFPHTSHCELVILFERVDPSSLLKSETKPGMKKPLLPDVRQESKNSKPDTPGKQQPGRMDVARNSVDEKNKAHVMKDRCGDGPPKDLHEPSKQGDRFGVSPGRNMENQRLGNDRLAGQTRRDFDRLPGRGDRFGSPSRRELDRPQGAGGRLDNQPLRGADRPGNDRFNKPAEPGRPPKADDSFGKPSLDGPPKMEDRFGRSTVGTRFNKPGAMEDRFGKQGNEDRFGKQGSEDRFGKQGSEDRFGKQGSEDRFGKQGSEDRFGKQGNEDRFGKQGNEDRFGKQGNEERFGKQGNEDRFARPPLLGERFDKPALKDDNPNRLPMGRERFDRFNRPPAMEGKFSGGPVPSEGDTYLAEALAKMRKQRMENNRDERRPWGQEPGNDGPFSGRESPGGPRRMGLAESLGIPRPGPDTSLLGPWVLRKKDGPQGLIKPFSEAPFSGIWAPIKKDGPPEMGKMGSEGTFPGPWGPMKKDEPSGKMGSDARFPNPWIQPKRDGPPDMGRMMPDVRFPGPWGQVKKDGLSDMGRMRSEAPFTGCWGPMRREGPQGMGKPGSTGIFPSPWGPLKKDGPQDMGRGGTDSQFPGSQGQLKQHGPMDTGKLESEAPFPGSWGPVKKDGAGSMGKAGDKGGPSSKENRSEKDRAPTAGNPAQNLSGSMGERSTSRKEQHPQGLGKHSPKMGASAGPKKPDGPGRPSFDSSNDKQKEAWDTSSTREDSADSQQPPERKKSRFSDSPARPVSGEGQQPKLTSPPGRGTRGPPPPVGGPGGPPPPIRGSGGMPPSVGGLGGPQPVVGFGGLPPPVRAPGVLQSVRGPPPGKGPFGDSKLDDNNRKLPSLMDLNLEPPKQQPLIGLSPASGNKQGLDTVTSEEVGSVGAGGSQTEYRGSWGPGRRQNSDRPHGSGASGQMSGNSGPKDKDSSEETDGSWTHTDNMRGPRSEQSPVTPASRSTDSDTSDTRGPTRQPFQKSDSESAQKSGGLPHSRGDNYGSGGHSQMYGGPPGKRTPEKGGPLNVGNLSMTYPPPTYGAPPGKGGPAGPPGGWGMRTSGISPFQSQGPPSTNVPPPNYRFSQYQGGDKGTPTYGSQSDQGQDKGGPSNLVDGKSGPGHDERVVPRGSGVSTGGPPNYGAPPPGSEQLTDQGPLKGYNASWGDFSSQGYQSLDSKTKGPGTSQVYGYSGTPAPYTQGPPPTTGTVPYSHAPPSGTLSYTQRPPPSTLSYGQGSYQSNSRQYGQASQYGSVSQYGNQTGAPSQAAKAQSLSASVYGPPPPPPDTPADTTTQAGAASGNQKQDDKDKKNKKDIKDKKEDKADISSEQADAAADYSQYSWWGQGQDTNQSYAAAMAAYHQQWNEWYATYGHAHYSQYGQYGQYGAYQQQGSSTAASPYSQPPPAVSGSYSQASTTDATQYSQTASGQGEAQDWKTYCAMMAQAWSSLADGKQGTQTGTQVSSQQGNQTQTGYQASQQDTQPQTGYQASQQGNQAQSGYMASQQGTQAQTGYQASQQSQAHTGYQASQQSQAQTGYTSSQQGQTQTGYQANQQGAQSQVGYPASGYQQSGYYGTQGYNTTS